MKGYGLLVGAGVGAAWLASPLSPKLRAALRGRRGVEARLREARPRLGDKPFWFHVASAGELEQALPILDALKGARPDRGIFLSYFSPSGAAAAERERRRREAVGGGVPWDHADYAPFDFPGAVGRFLDLLDPGDLVILHRELWPGMLAAAKARGVRCHLFGAFLDPRRKRLPFALGALDSVGTTDARTLERFSSRLAPRARAAAAGDPRVDRVLARKSLRAPSPWREKLKDRPLFVAASLRDEDFAALEPTLETVDRAGWRIILVPHEPEERRLRRLERRFPVAVRWSRWEREGHPSRHLLVDGVGWLAELYEAADLVFVGGGFKAKVHNVLEPAAWGKPILTGPFIYNSAEAIEMAEAGVGLKRVDSPQALRRAAAQWIRDPEARREAARWLDGYLRSRRGAAERYARWLLDAARA